MSLSDDVFEAADLHTAVEVAEMEVVERQSPASPDVIPPTEDEDSDAPATKRTRPTTSESPDFAPEVDHKRLVSWFIIHVTIWARFLKETPTSPAIVLEWLMMRSLAAPVAVKKIVKRLNQAFQIDSEQDQEEFQTFSRWCGTLHDAFFMTSLSSQELKIWKHFVHECSTLCSNWSRYLLIVFHPAAGNNHVHIIHNCKWDRRQRRCVSKGVVFVKSNRFVEAKISSVSTPVRKVLWNTAHSAKVCLTTTRDTIG